MNKYYKVIATLEGEQETLFGSFVKADCTYEIESEKESWKSDGYKGIKIISEETTDTPDKEVYKDQLYTSQQFFMQQAPSFNFEKNKEELIEHAIEVGFLTKVEGEDDLYLLNTEYEL